MLAVPGETRPPLRFLPLKNPWLLAFSRPGSWIFLRILTRVRSIDVRNLESLARLYQQFQEGRIRLLIAFRHPHVDDGPVIFRLTNVLVGNEARRLGVKLRRPPRGYFLYGRDVPEWAGRYLAWMFPRMGGISVFPGKFDSESLSLMRRTVADGDHPLTLAPEGQVTYHNERVSRLEPGAAQLAFWCMEDLARKGRDEEVLIVPVCASYHYRESDRRGLDVLLARVEARCGLEHRDGRAEAHPYARLMLLFHRVIEIAEGFYSRHYGRDFPRCGEAASPQGLQRRIEAVCDAALATAESFFGLTARGDFVERVMSARYAGLSLLHSEAAAGPDGLSPLEKALAARVAAEAWLRLRHMELVDVLEYLRADYLSPDADLDRCVEYALNLADVVSRLEGGNVSGRPNPFAKAVRIMVNEPIPVSPYREAYRSHRRKAVAALTEELLRSFRSTAERH